MAKREYKLSAENAKEQLDLFFDWYNLDLEEAAKEQGKEVDSDEAKAELYKPFYPVIRAIRQGAIEFKVESSKEGETLVAIQRLFRPIGPITELKYGEVTARACSLVKTGNSASEKYQFLGILCGEGKPVIDKVRGPDVQVLDMLGSLFLLG